MAIKGKVFYPTTTPHFAVPDGTILPVVGIGVGAKAFKVPSGETYIFTGAEWVPFEPSLANIEKILQRMEVETEKIAKLMAQIVEDTEK